MARAISSLVVFLSLCAGLAFASALPAVMPSPLTSSSGGSANADAGPPPVVAFSPAPIHYWPFDDLTGADLAAGPSGHLAISGAAASSVELAVAHHIVTARSSYSIVGGDFYPDRPSTSAGWFVINAPLYSVSTLWEQDNYGNDWSLLFVGDDLRFYGFGNPFIDLGHLSTGVLYHVAIVNDADATVHGYVNGVEVATSTGGHQPDHAQAFQFGDDPHFGDRTGNFELDEWALWNVALSSSKIAELYTRGLAHTPLQ